MPDCKQNKKHLAESLGRGADVPDVSNLLHNAAKWARQRVLVAADRVGPMVEMEIEDNGPGPSPISRRSVSKGLGIAPAA
jgi:hypothetical protein